MEVSNLNVVVRHHFVCFVSLVLFVVQRKEKMDQTYEETES